MSKDILIETHGNTIVVGMPGTFYRIRYRRPNSGRQLVAYQLPKGDDPTAPLTSGQFMLGLARRDRQSAQVRVDRELRQIV